MRTGNYITESSLRGAKPRGNLYIGSIRERQHGLLRRACNDKKICMLMALVCLTLSCCYCTLSYAESTPKSPVSAKRSKDGSVQALLDKLHAKHRSDETSAPKKPEIALDTDSYAPKEVEIAPKPTEPTPKQALEPSLPSKHTPDKHQKPIIHTKTPHQAAISPKTKLPVSQQDLTPKKSLSERLEGWYVRADGGVNASKKTKKEKIVLPPSKPFIRFRPGLMTGVGIGYKINKVLRADLNFQYRYLKAKRKTDVQIDKIKQPSMFLNSYVHLTDTGYLFPYLTIGLGFAKNKVNNTKYSPSNIGSVKTHTKDKGINFVWNAGLGAILNITKNIQIDVTYKYLDFGSFKGYITTIDSSGNTVIPFTGSFKTNNLYSHEFSGGLIINL